MSNAERLVATLSLPAALLSHRHWQWTRRNSKRRTTEGLQWKIDEEGESRRVFASPVCLVWMLSASRAQLTSDNERPRVNTMTEQTEESVSKRRRMSYSFDTGIRQTDSVFSEMSRFDFSVKNEEKAVRGFLNVSLVTWLWIRRLLLTIKYSYSNYKKTFVRISITAFTY